MKNAKKIILSLGIAAVLPLIAMCSGPLPETSPSNLDAEQKTADVSQSGNTGFVPAIPSAGESGAEKNIVTYIGDTYDDGYKAVTSYIPISYLRNGEQVLVGDISLSRQDIPTENRIWMEKRPLNDDPGGENNRGLVDYIATNGDWELFPEPVTYASYTLKNQPGNAVWSDYFSERLAEEGADSPVIIRESWAFTWNGVPAEVVTAGNVTFTTAGSFFQSGASAAGTDAPTAPTAAYILSVLFLEGREPVELEHSCTVIPAAGTDSPGISYRVTESPDLSLAFYAAQSDGAGGTALYPVYCDMYTAVDTRDYEFRPQFLLCDGDGDGASELIVNRKSVSSLYWSTRVYKLEGHELTRYAVIYE